MAKIKLTDEFMDEIATHFNELMLEQFDSDPYSTLEDYVPSEKHKKAMAEMLGNKPKKRRVSKSVRTVLIVAAVLVMLFACAMSVSAVRRAVYRFFFSFEADHAVVCVSTEDNMLDSRSMTMITYFREPSFIPEGFEEIKRTELEAKLKIVYQSDNCFITYRQETILDHAQVDTEKAFSTEIDMNGTIGYYSSTNHQNVLIWYDDEYIYKITSTLDIDTIIIIAESVK